MSLADHGGQTPVRDLAVLVKMFPKLSETFILEEILGLERMGIRVRLYALSAPSDAIAHPVVGRVRAVVKQAPALRWTNIVRYAIGHACAFARSPLRYFSALRAAATIEDGWGVLSQAAWLASVLRRDGCRHLHVHFISRPADVGRLAASMASLPFSISAHAKDIYLSDRDALRRRLEAARFTVTCTQYNVEVLAGVTPHARVHRMYHGVDREQFMPAPCPSDSSAPLLLSVGRLREKKGLDVLIDACRILRDRGTTFRCEIVGYGEERDRLLRRIAAHGLTDAIFLLGKMTREQVIERYRRAMVYVQPSRIMSDGDRDGIPNVLLEAMAMELPVVASNVSGIPELIDHGRNGLLVPSEHPAALATALDALLADPRLRRRLGTQGRCTVADRFDNDRNLRLLCKLLEDAGAREEPVVERRVVPIEANPETK